MNKNFRKPDQAGDLKLKKSILVIFFPFILIVENISFNLKIPSQSTAQNISNKKKNKNESRLLK